jgi:glycosyltransferase involved in cell wall biosynthesis
MQAGTIPIVANNSSLPEVVGQAGFLVAAKDTHQVSDAMLTSYQMPYKELLKYKTAMRRQAKKFDWQESAKIILKILEHEK